jgi:hypothetical protein
VRAATDRRRTARGAGPAAPRRQEHRLTALALGIGMLTAAAWPARDAAAAWEVVPEVGLFTEVDDNARIVPGDNPSSTRGALDARIRLRNFGERGEAYIEPRIVADAYADARDEELENDDLFLITRAARNFENSTLSFQTDYRRESVLRSEIDDALLDDPILGEAPIDTGSGTFGTFTDERERFDVGLDYALALSDRTRLTLESSIVDVAYLENQSTTRSDFDDTTFGVVLTRLVDQRNEVSARVYFSDFEAVRNDNNTDTFGVEGSFLRPVSQTWTFELNAGVARTDFSFLDVVGQRIENADSSFTFGVAFNKRSEATTWTIGAGHTLSPGSDGFLAERDEMRAQVRHQLTPRLTLSGGLRAAQLSRAAASAGIDNERDYSRVSLEVEWFMTPRWLLTTGLDRVDQEFVGSGDDAASNSVFVGVRYQGLSRP